MTLVLVFPDRRDLKVNKVIKEREASSDWRDTKDSRESPDHGVDPVHKVPMEQMGQSVKLELKEKADQVVDQEHVDHLVHQVDPVHQVRLETQDHRESRDFPDSMDSGEKLDQMD